MSVLSTSVQHCIGGSNQGNQARKREKKYLTVKKRGRYSWFISIILATQGTEIRTITVQTQPQANSSGDPSLRKKGTKKGWWSGSNSKSALVQTLVLPKTKKKRKKKRKKERSNCCIRITHIKEFFLSIKFPVFYN
jgi:hypothetical protein